jgi:hypothetical protein
MTVEPGSAGITELRLGRADLAGRAGIIAAEQAERAREISPLTRSCTPLVVCPVARSLSITAWKRSTSPEQPEPEGMRKVLGVTPGAACDGGGAGGGLPDGVWQAESRSAAKAGTRTVEARIGKAPADRAGTMTDSLGPAKLPVSPAPA